MKKIMVSIIGLTFFSLQAYAAVQTKEIKYTFGETEFTGFLAFDDAVSGKRPGILVAHEWWGHDDNSRKRATQLAKLGYTAFALDMYGTGQLAQHPDDAKKFMQAAVGSLPQAETRFKAAYEILKKEKTVNPEKIAAIGYCLGGGLVMHMARTGIIPLNGVVSFHGSFAFATQTPSQPGQTKTKVLAFTGADDPFVPIESVQAFVKSMTEAGVDYELKSYPGVQHGFTVEDSTEKGKKFSLPLAYDAAADKDSWQRMQVFFKEIF
ncbi:MAG: dienelactone hydrolase family protein [Gammaproteobacteria bacterium]|nr:dienelactone hydrolase family protein [Gammaproteobacteria bacterium]